MIKGSFIIIMTCSWALSAFAMSDVDPNLARNPDRRQTESGLSCPVGDCGPTVIMVDPAPQVTELAPRLNRILESHGLKNLPAEDVQAIQKDLDEGKKFDRRVEAVTAEVNSGNKHSDSEQETIQDRLKQKMESSTGGFSGKIRRKGVQIHYKKEFN